MHRHIALGDTNFTRKRSLAQLINSGNITLGGYSKTKIYGTLSCASGKRMHIKNRVFFTDEREAIAAGYRPCGNCLAAQYKKWKLQNESI